MVRSLLVVVRARQVQHELSVGLQLLVKQLSWNLMFALDQDRSQSVCALALSRPHSTQVVFACDNMAGCSLVFAKGHEPFRRSCRIPLSRLFHLLSPSHVPEHSIHD